MNVEAFLHWKRGFPSRVELVNGEPMPMNTAGTAKRRVIDALYEAVWSASSPPHGAIIEAAVAIKHRNDALYHPAIAVTDKPFAATAASCNDPIAVMEVVEPGDAEVAYGVKLQDYIRLPSVREIVMVECASHHVQHWQRLSEDRWTVTMIVPAPDAVLALGMLEVPLPLERLFMESGADVA